MEIGILEYQNFHSEYTNSLKQICEDHNVNIFNDIQKAKETMGSLDLLFVNTIRPLPWDMLNWITFKPKCKTILTIHEVNTDFKTMKQIIKKFDAISVPLQQMKDYIIEKKLYHKQIYTFPFMLHEKVYPNKNKMIVVPGKIEKFRRNYDTLWNKMNKSDYWCFLGQPIGNYGQVVLKLCEKMRELGYSIKTFDDFVPNDIYDDILKNCKSIVSPLRTPTKGYNKIFNEYYGKTKACGAMFESVKYGKKFVNNLDLKLDYKNFLLKDWKKYLEKEVLEEIKWSKKGY